MRCKKCNCCNDWDQRESILINEKKDAAILAGEYAIKLGVALNALADISGLHYVGDRSYPINIAQEAIEKIKAER